MNDEFLYSNSHAKPGSNAPVGFPYTDSSGLILVKAVCNVYLQATKVFFIKKQVSTLPPIYLSLSNSR